jgi:hypothetical protein
MAKISVSNRDQTIDFNDSRVYEVDVKPNGNLNGKETQTNTPNKVRPDEDHETENTITPHFKLNQKKLGKALNRIEISDLT